MQARSRSDSPARIVCVSVLSRWGGPSFLPNTGESKQLLLLLLLLLGDKKMVSVYVDGSNNVT